MITNHRMGLKIWRIQRIKIPGITETKRKPLDYKARQRVGMIASRKKPSHTKAFSPRVPAVTTEWQHYLNDCDNKKRYLI